MDFRMVAARLRATRVPPADPPRPPAVAGRAAEVAQVVEALREPGATVVLHGPAGSGTTTLARLVRADPRLRRHFRDRIHWVTLGPHARLGALASKINKLVRVVDPTRADPAPDVAEAAADLVAALTGGPARLLILDDVRSAEQLAGFPVGGSAARLITTRRTDLAGGPGRTVELDRMPDDLARAVLTAGHAGLSHSGLSSDTVAELIALSDGRPRTLRRANRLLADRPDPRATAIALERDGAVAALADLLGPDERDRFAELGVFADDFVPVELVLGLWQATAGLRPPDGEELLGRLADLRLVARSSTGAGDTVRLPGAGFVAPRLHAVLLDSVPAPAESRYLRHHFVEHRLAAERGFEPAAELGWLAVRLERDGLAGPLADLDCVSAGLDGVSSGAAGRLRRLLDRAAHLLTPADPPRAVTDILLSRLADDPEFGPAVAHLETQPTAAPLPAGGPVAALPWIGLVHDGPLPDRLDRALVRTVISGSWVQALGIAPDSSWLAAGTVTGEVRGWHTGDGSLRLRLDAHPGAVHALAIAPGGEWLATAGDDDLVRLWDAATGERLAELDCGSAPVWAVAIEPGGEWLVTGAEDGAVRVWDASTRRPRRHLRGTGDPVRSLAISPDGSEVAAGDFTGEIRIWDVMSGKTTQHFSSGSNVSALAFHPDGATLAAAHWSSAVQLWDLPTEHSTRLGSPSTCLAWAPDGSWLAAGELDDRVRLWDTNTARAVRRYPGHRASTDALTWVDGRVDALAVSPDGRWLATGGQDELVRLWETNFGPRQVPTGGPIRAAALSPDGSSFLTATDQAIRIGPHFVVAPGPVSAAAVSDDGDWFVLADDRTVRDSTTGAVLATLTGHQGAAAAVLVAPGSGWLATWGPDAPLQVWARDSGRLAWLRRGPQVAAFALDGQTIAATEDDRMFVLLDTATGLLRHRFASTTATATVTGLAVGPSWIAAAHGPVLDVLGIDGERRARYRTSGVIRSVAVAPDGMHLATVDSRRCLQIWSVTEGPVAAMRVDQVPYTCAWTSPRTVTVGGAAGVYHFRLRSTGAY
jgi:WD40 repeat protein